jgi:hypothetical protein
LFTPTADVKLPLTVRAEFPPTCIVCGAGNPDVTVTVFTPVHKDWLSWFPSGRVWVDAPACDTCAPAFRWQQRRRTAIRWLLTLAGVAFGLWLYRYFLVPQFLLRDLLLLTCVVFGVPLWIWHKRVPPSLWIYADRDRLIYQFRNGAYAAAFAKLNGVAPPAGEYVADQ